MTTFHRNQVATLRAAKEQAQDFEWYPTTPEIIKAVQHDIMGWLTARTRWDIKLPSVLDCGAGDGRVLKSLTDKGSYLNNGILDEYDIEEGRVTSSDDLFAIEKSATLLQLMSPKIMIVGTDFYKQTLLDKESNVTFCNPPYSEFSDWVVKIIMESLSPKLYFVIPRRWSSNKQIKKALEEREAVSKVIGEFDFFNADRNANVEVDLIRVDLDVLRVSKYNSGPTTVEPFEKWFDNHFQIGKVAATKDSKEEKLKNQLLVGGNPVETLVELYNHKLKELTDLYSLLGTIDASLLNEMNISQTSACGALKQKIKTLKNHYWKELFDRMDSITNRLTVKSRDKMLKKLFRHNSVDFDLANAYAVVEWACKNADQYIDEQLKDLFRQMLSDENITKYKSNKRIIEGSWRYCNLEDKSKSDYVGLDYRIIMHDIGVVLDSFSSNKPIKGMSTEGTNFLNNLRVIAYNLGFDTFACAGAESFEWGSRTKHSLKYFDHTEGVEKTIFDATSFKNQNIWLSINRGFLAHLNVEMGRLMGWVSSPQEAAEELNIPLEEAERAFYSRVGLPREMNLLIAA